MTTPILGTTELAENETNPHIRVNEAIRRLEATKLVLSRTNGGPPGSTPSDGDAYIVDVASGDWSGFTVGDIAYYVTSSWVNITPPSGLQVTVVDETVLSGRPVRVVYTGSGWLRAPGVLNMPTKVVSSNHTITQDELGYLFLVDTSGGTVTLTLPAVADSGDAVVAVVKTAAANEAIIDGNSSETISGETTKTLEDQWASTQIACDATQWVEFGGGGSASFPFADDNDLFANAADLTKILKFALSGITTGTTRTATWPDKDGTVAMTSDIAGGGNASNEFDEDAGTTTGLTWGYQAGGFRIGSDLYALSAGTITLDDDATNYVYIDIFSQTVNHNTTGFGYGQIPLREVVTSSGSQTSSDDKRAWLQYESPDQAVVDKGNSGAGTVTLDYRDGQTQKITATGDFTLAHSNWPASGIAADMDIIAVNWGAHSPALPASWDWGDAGVPTFSSSGTDHIVLVTEDGGTTIHAMLAGSGF